MKRLSLALLFAVLLINVSCKKEEKDPRDQFVGTYSLTQTTSVPSLEYSNVSSGTNIITKSSTDPNKILISDGSGDIQTAIVNGNSYTYDKYTVIYNDGEVTGTVEVTGEGTINGNVINETGTCVYSFYGNSYPGTWTCVLTKQ